MNSFFFKSLISSSSNNQKSEQEQSDFERLIELCNSYGLNEQQTKQLISEFKKGSYSSGQSSLNQSMMSDQNEMSMSQNCDKSQQNYQHQQSLEPSRLSHPYPPTQYYHEGQSTNRYYGYGNEIEEKDQDSYNEMTFNEQNNSLLMNNSNKFHEGMEEHFTVEGPLTSYQLKQEALLHQQKKIPQTKTQHKLLQRNNSRKQTLIQNRNSPEHSLENTLQATRMNDTNKNARDSISTKMISQQGQKNSAYDYSRHPKTSQQSSKMSQNSMQQHSIENQPENGLNPEYVKALIRNFQLLEGENQTLKEEISTLQKKNQLLGKENQLVKRENERLKKEIDEMKSKEKMSTNEASKFEALYDAEKQKNQMLLSMKEKDSELIKGLKDSLMQLTELVKQKDSQNNELQQRLFSLYEKLQNQNSSNSSQYLGNQGSGNDFKQTGGSAATFFGKSFSKKSLGISESEKSIRPNLMEEQREREKERERERSSNYGRKQLNQIIGNNINLPSNTLHTKQLKRQPSASRLNSSSNQQANFKKQSSLTPVAKQLSKESKENVFTPLQVQPSHRRTHNIKPTEEDTKKRPSSRVDIKKYKGMIEELRNSYSNVGNGNPIMR